MVKPIQVFISYSHDSETHMDRVVELSNKLREYGIDCMLDQYKISPEEGWPKWCYNQIIQANFVIVICSEIYYQRFQGRAPRGSGAGAKWEGFIIAQKLYENEGKNNCFIPVVFTKYELKYIPTLLGGVTHYVLNNDEEYPALYRCLINQSRIRKPELGAPLILRTINRNFDKPAKESRITKYFPKGMTFICNNERGYDEFRWEKDSSVMIRIPAGEFWMGSVLEEGGRDHERPQHSVILNEFYIDKFEVTNRQFYNFVESTGYRTTAEKKGSGFVFNSLKQIWEECRDMNWRNYYNRNTESHPVVLVTPADAKAYCEWAGKRLPTEAEWEKAARGIYGWKYPWGDPEPDNSYANFMHDKSGTTPVGSYPKGVSPSGCMDMAGNVWEWCNDFYSGTYYHNSPKRNPKGPTSSSLYVNRGGSWHDSVWSLRCANRSGDDPKGFCHLGFRCAL